MKKYWQWKKRRRKELPNKAWELLELAYECVLDLEYDPLRYVITQEYDSNMFHAYAALLDKTAVNFAGAIVARHFGIDRKMNIKMTEYNEDIFRKLLAIDLLTNFEIYEGLELIHRGSSRMFLCKMLSKAYKDIDVHYEQEPESYKYNLEVLITLLRELEL